MTQILTDKQKLPKGPLNMSKTYAQTDKQMNRQCKKRKAVETDGGNPDN